MTTTRACNRFIPAARAIAAILLFSLQIAGAITFNIEIDYMDSTASGGHSHKPQPDEIAAVVQIFAGQIGTPFDRAATLAHEFGHNLGLPHGAVNAFQPNKPSIMSYFYQLSGVRSASLAAGLSTVQTSLFKELDYSDGTMCGLNEF